ncbi:hypothetical protein B0A49_03664 [Cryomyces minteri]|uniref:Uncharacterized protein n=1 Tax=Cryomyces minteri TaxID=331657 RepID=A0A4U0XIW9_9PEZI|nr:hypothetical protein B0A49_03664 [Cryomyces minteri]
MPQTKRRVDYHGLTKLAKACEKGPLEAVQAALENDPGALDIADNDGNTPLQHASLHGHKDIVEFLIGKDCRLDTFNISKHDTPLIDAVENSETDIVRVLLDAGVDPHCQNLEGNQPLDLLPDDDTKDEIEELLRAAIRKASVKSGSRPPLKHEQSVSQQPTAGPNLLYLDPNTKNLYKMAQIGDDKTVSEWIGRARVAPDHSCVKVAARGGHIICVRHLLAHIGEKDYEQYMLATIGRGHHAMVEFFIEQDDFDPTQRSEQTGKTYFEIAEERQGPNWQEERDALKDAYDKYVATHHGGHEPSSSPQVQKSRARTRGGPSGSLKVRKRGASGETIDRPKRKKLLSARVYRRDASSSEDEGEISSVVESHADMEMSPEPMLRESPARLRAASQTRSGSSESHSQLLSRRSPSKRALPPPSAPEDKQLDTAMDLDQETAVAPLPHHSIDITSQPLTTQPLTTQPLTSQPLTSQPLRSQDPSGIDFDMTEEELAARLAEKEAEIEAERTAQRAAERALAEKRDAEVAAEAERMAAIERQQLEARRLQDIEDQRLKELEEAKRQAERAEQRQLMLDRLPNWIAAALQRNNESAQPSSRDSILPVQVVKYLEIDQECIDEVQREEPWMLNVQAAAMLQWADLTSGLEGTSIAEKWSTAEVTPAHRSIMFQALGGHRKLARADKDSYRKFLDMPDLYWVRFEDFLQAVKEQSKQDPSAANHDLEELRWEAKGDYHVDWIPDPGVPKITSEPQVNGSNPVEAAAPAQARHDTAMLDDGELLEAGPNKSYQMNGTDPHLHTNGVASLAPPAVRAKRTKMVRRFALQLRESGVVGWVPVQKEFNRTKIKARRFKGGQELVREEGEGV